MQIGFPVRPSGRWAPALGALAAAVAFGSLGVIGCEDDGDDGTSSEPLAAKLARTYRIDVSESAVTYDLFPGRARIRGRAVVRFEMRPGQQRPLFHFNPLRRPTGPERKALTGLSLDGERLDPASRRDLRTIRPAPTAERALEIQRDVDPAAMHTLRADWSIPNRGPKSNRGWFVTDYDDTIGPDDETETFWPTISSPEDLARDRFRVRVHGSRPYVLVGSGALRRVPMADAQGWMLDTERGIASHTVLLAAIPAVDVRTSRLDVDGVPVRIVSDRSQGLIDRGRRTARATVSRLVDDLGPFPMRRMDILLTGWGSGMEYYGATRTGLGSLEHELAHMYFGASTVNRTWRDTWFDEASVQWWQRQDRLKPVPPEFRSGIVGGRTVVEPGFDESAYGAGARILAAVAGSLGGSERMVDFLADLHGRRSFDPFTTEELIDDIEDAGSDLEPGTLRRWLYAR